MLAELAIAVKAMGPAWAMDRCRNEMSAGTDSIPPPAPVRPIRSPIRRPSMGVVMSESMDIIMY